MPRIYTDLTDSRAVACCVAAPRYSGASRKACEFARRYTGRCRGASYFPGAPISTYSLRCRMRALIGFIIIPRVPNAWFVDYSLTFTVFSFYIFERYYLSWTAPGRAPLNAGKYRGIYDVVVLIRGNCIINRQLSNETTAVISQQRLAADRRFIIVDLITLNSLYSDPRTVCGFGFG